MSKKSGPPAHANKEKWVPARADKHNTLKKLVAALPNEGVCKRCKEQIEWKKEPKDCPCGAPAPGVVRLQLPGRLPHRVPDVAGAAALW